MNKAQFKLFKKHVKKWRDCFGLNQYRLTVEFDKIEDADTAAETGMDAQNGLAHITLNKNCYGLSDKFLNELAFHEVVEVLLNPLRSMANRHYNWQLVDKEIHQVIRTLENVVLK